MTTLDPYHNWRTPEDIERLRKITEPLKQKGSNMPTATAIVIGPNGAYGPFDSPWQAEDWARDATSVMARWGWTTVFQMYELKAPYSVNGMSVFRSEPATAEEPASTTVTAIGKLEAGTWTVEQVCNE